jgi:hypothetical protein
MEPDVKTEGKTRHEKKELNTYKRYKNTCTSKIYIFILKIYVYKKRSEIQDIEKKLSDQPRNTLEIQEHNIYIYKMKTEL